MFHRLMGTVGLCVSLATAFSTVPTVEGVELEELLQLRAGGPCETAHETLINTCTKCIHSQVYQTWTRCEQEPSETICSEVAVVPPIPYDPFCTEHDEPCTGLRYHYRSENDCENQNGPPVNSDNCRRNYKIATVIPQHGDECQLDE